MKYIYAILLFSFSITVQAQVNRSAKVEGVVTTSDGKPVDAVSISLKGTSLGSSTNAKGEFLVKNVRPGNYTLVVTGVAIKRQEKTFTVQNGQTLTVNFMLDVSAQALQEVTVNGSKTNKFAVKESDYVAKMPLKNLENPQVYTSVGKELLTEQLVFSVDDAMRNATGMQKMWEATGRGGDGGSYYSSRGFISQSTLRNGIAGNVTSTIDAVNLEKLEVIKGPSATLFGSALSSYGGVINRVTKKPYENFGGEIALSGGNFDFYRASVDLNTPVDKSKKLMFRINSAYNNEGSFQNVGFSRSFTATPSLLYKPNDKLSVQLDAELFYGKNIGKQILFFYSPAAALGASRAQDLNLDYRNFYTGNGLTQTSRSSNFFGQVNYKISPAFTSSTNFTSSNNFSNGFGPYLYLVPTAAGNFIQRADQSTNNSKASVTEIQQNFNGDFRVGSLRNRIVLGLDFLRQNNNQNFFGSVFGNTAPLTPGFDYSTFNGTNMAALYAGGPAQFDYPVTTKINTYSAFVSDVLNLTDNFSVLAALRVDRYDNKGGKVGADVTAYSQTAFSPKFGIVFQPVKDKVSLFANYQNSFRNNGTYIAYDVTMPDSIVARNAQLEQANQIEGGIKLDLLEGKLGATVSYYNIQVSNLLRADPSAPALAQIQDGTQLSKGIEFEVIANPAKGLNLVAGFTYNDSKFTRADADVNNRRPSTASSPYLADFWASYRFTETAVKGLGFGFGGNYASENKILNSISQGVFTLPAYTILNASAFYDVKKLRISAKMDNITNQKYWIGYTTMNPQRLRSFAVSMAYKF